MPRDNYHFVETAKYCRERAATARSNVERERWHKLAVTACEALAAHKCNESQRENST